MFTGERGTKLMARWFGLLGLVGVSATYFYGFSKFHLLWWVPVSLITTMILAQAYVRREVRSLFENNGHPTQSTTTEKGNSAKSFLQEFEAFSELNSVLKTLSGQVAEGTVPRKAFLLNYADQMENALSCVQRLEIMTSRLPSGHMLSETARKGTATAANAMVDAASSLHEMAQCLLADALDRQIKHMEAKLARASDDSLEDELELEDAEVLDRVANTIIQRAATAWQLAEEIGQKYAVAAKGEA